MENFYDKLSEIKEYYKLTYKVLGEQIDKKETAFKMAVERKSLSRLEQKTLEEYFLELEERHKKSHEKTGEKPIIDLSKPAKKMVVPNLNPHEVALYVLKHGDELRKAVPEFDVWVVNKEVTYLNSYLREKLSKVKTT